MKDKFLHTTPITKQLLDVVITQPLSIIIIIEVMLVLTAQPRIFTHCEKSVQIRSFFCSVNLSIQSENGKIQNSKNFRFVHQFKFFSEYQPYVKVFTLRSNSWWFSLKLRQKRMTEAVVRRCSTKQMFLKISQNSQENTCFDVSFLKSCSAQTLYKKRLERRCSPVNFAKLLRTPC